MPPQFFGQARSALHDFQVVGTSIGAVGLTAGTNREACPMKLLAAAVAIAAIFATPDVAAAQTGTAPYCIQTLLGTRCVFGTLGECEAYRGNTSPDQCITRTDAHGTTGLGERPFRRSGPPAYPDLPPIRPQDLGR
jgi:hypothetical protein